MITGDLKEKLSLSAYEYAEKHNLSITSEIGSGVSGVAFVTDTNTVIKITTSKPECDYAKAVFEALKQGKTILRCANIYDIVNVTYNYKQEKKEAYVITQELLDTSIKDEDIRKLEERLNESGYEFEDIKWISDKCADYVDKNQIPLVKEIAQVFDELEHIGVWSDEVLHGNIGVRNGLIAVFDQET
jgi:hypothetical protein